jgi:hypothetical protein
VPTFRPYAAENLEFGGFYASRCESRVSLFGSGFAGLGGQNQRDKDRAKCGADGGLRRPRCVFRHRRLQSGWGCNLTLLSAASYTEFAEAQPRQNG